MARMKFLCDAERCIECNACVTACKNEHEVPWGVNRRRVVTIQDGKPGERSISVACMHCFVFARLAWAAVLDGPVRIVLAAGPLAITPRFGLTRLKLLPHTTF